MLTCVGLRTIASYFATQPDHANRVLVAARASSLGYAQLTSGWTSFTHEAAPLGRFGPETAAS